MSTNGDRIAALAEFRARHPSSEDYRRAFEQQRRAERPPWMREKDDATVGTIARAVQILAGIFLGALLLLGAWDYFAPKTETFEQQVSRECLAANKVPHAYHDASGKLLGVRCDLPEPTK